MSNKLYSALTLGLGLGLASLAQAGFIGNTVTGEHMFPTKSSVFETHSALVGGGTEFAGVANACGGGGYCYSVDVSDTGLLITMIEDGLWTTGSGISFNGFHLADTNGTIDDIASVALSTNNWAGFADTRISFDTNNIWVDFQSLAHTANQSSVALEVTFRTNGNGGNGVPEPATLALLGLGLVGLGLSRRRTA